MLLIITMDLKMVLGCFILIPDVSKIERLYSNLETLNIPDLTGKEMEAVKAVYDEMILPLMHHHW